jgi:putative ABC transport system ATP-binding protein
MICLSNVHKSYQSEQGNVQVLKNLNLTVNKADFVGLLGRSGEGKSTLLNILGGFDGFNSGQYQFLNTDVNDLNDKQLNKFRMHNIGFVFQSFHLIKHLTVLKNVELPLLLQKVPEKERRARALIMLERLGVADKCDYYPKQLSGGQCQRIAIARALIAKPELILADEPTGSLDRETADSILSLFKELNEEGHTIVLVTHDPIVVAKSDTVYELNDGQLRKYND